MLHGDDVPLVLVAEGNERVGTDLCAALREAGYRVVGPVATIAGAESVLDREAPDFAVIETRLADGDSAGTMERLRRRGVPFLVHSHVALAGSDARAFADAPWLAKPAMPWDVVTVLDEMAIREPVR